MSWVNFYNTSKEKDELQNLLKLFKAIVTV